MFRESASWEALRANKLTVDECLDLADKVVEWWQEFGCGHGVLGIAPTYTIRLWKNDQGNDKTILMHTKKGHHVCTVPINMGIPQQIERFDVLFEKADENAVKNRIRAMGGLRAFLRNGQKEQKS
jgi:hypothetical protein